MTTPGARRHLRGERAELRLLVLLALFFVALSVPAGLLAYRALEQSRWEVFHRYRLQAEALVRQVDQQLGAAIAEEDARGFAEYSFPGSGAADSPLAQFPPPQSLPGVVGYFQIESDGEFSTPMLPPVNIPQTALGDRAERQRRAHRLREVLAGADRDDIAAGMRTRGATAVGESEEALAEAVSAAPAGAAGNSLFKRLADVSSGKQKDESSSSYGNVADLQLDQRLEQKSLAQKNQAPQTGESVSGFARQSAPARRATRKEKVAVLEARDRVDAMVAPDTEADFAEIVPPAAGAPAQVPTPATPAVMPDLAARPTVTEAAPLRRVRLFESEVDPLSVRRLDDHHLLMFRNVWRDGERLVQGLVLDQAVLLDAIIAETWRSSALADIAALLVAWEGDVLALEGAVAGEPLTRAASLRGELLYRARLSAPLSALELVFSVRDLPLGASAAYLAWVLLALAVVLAAGCYTMFRFGRGQIRLFRQQQDFVSAVSHELKTPLTSIRMYSEMLKAGWADDNRKQDYYTYIHDESERLSRLINNVLQLARITRGQADLNLKTVRLEELLDIVRSRLDSQLRAAGFELELVQEGGARDHSVIVDEDAVIQILINFVDNAIKFTPADARHAVQLACRVSGADVRLSVRDYGLGVAREQMQRIFDLFYRGENELTRATVGTGIGLALVRELARGMGATVDVSNRDPGAEFALTLPLAPTHGAENSARS